TNASITLAWTSGITDPTGLAITSGSVSFSTAAGPNFTGPAVLASSVANGASNVPVGAVFNLTFSEPMDTRSFQYGNTIYLHDANFGTLMPAVMTYLADGSQVTVAPQSALAADRPYYLQVCSVYDLTGNRMQGCFSANFTTALNPVAPLAVTGIIPINGSTAVDTNIRPTVQFSHPVSEPSAAANITLTQGGNPVPIHLGFSNADTLVTISPVSMLLANLPYAITVNGGSGGLVDAAANNQPLSLVANLATGEASPGVPLANGASDAQWTVSGPSVASGPALVLSPASRYPNWFADDSNSQWIGVHDSVSQPSAQYTFTATFTLTNPASAVLNVNWSIDDAGTLLLNGVPIASGASYGSFQNVTLSGSSGLLVAGTNTLSITMTSSDGSYDGVRLLGTVSEQAANPPAAGTFLPATVTANFSTGVSIDTDAPATVSMTPPNGSLTATNPVLRVVYGEPMDPVNSGNWYVSDNNTGLRVPLSAAWSSDLETLTLSYAGFTNALGNPGQLNPSTGYTFCTGNVYDFAGNQASQACRGFTTGAASDTAAPLVVSATPPNGATSVPLNAIIAITFSQAMDPTTLNPASLLWSPALPGAWSLSADGTTLTFAPSAPLAPSTTYTLTYALGAISDVNGNALAAGSLSFSTGTTSFSGNPTISLTSPAQGATGVSVNAPIT
ncbi:MAG: Ig-like domain-containing protein, partial [Terriglobales bacterium]